MTDAVATGHPAYGRVRPVSAVASVLTEANPGPMTLDGTNTWLLRAPGAEGVVVVDPGEGRAEHLAVLEALPVELVLVTHRHWDHTAAIDALAERTGAPVRARDASLVRGGAPLVDDELVRAAGLGIRVVATPGHTADSTSFVVEGAAPAVLTGDTILGRGTTVLDDTDGDLGQYLDSLDRLEAIGTGLPGLPGHGPELPDVGAAAATYREHRLARLAQVREAIAELGAGADVRAVVERVYRDVDPAMWPAAERSVAVQMAYLARTDR